MAGSNYNKSDKALTSRVWPGQIVYLRQFQTGDFVTASVNGTTITDAYDHIIDDDIRRFHIRYDFSHLGSDIPEETNLCLMRSATANVFPSSKWRILYDANKDQGFRLWNEEAQCFLATSFRTYPNMRGRPSNDTVLQTLDLELEACCTYPPSRAASTLYAVDGEWDKFLSPLLTSLASLSF